MRHWIVCLHIALISCLGLSQAKACGPMYPYGEDLRFHLIRPELFGLQGFAKFNYCTHDYYYYNNEDDTQPEQPDNYDNIKLWMSYCKNECSESDIAQAVYELDISNIHPASRNGMIHYLYQIHDTAALDYLRFAKSCEAYNVVYGDPWERSDTMQLPARSAFTEQALQRATKHVAQLRKRYLFLAIRLAYYDAQKELVEKIYKEHFEGNKQKDLIDYWALYFLTMVVPEGPLQNFYAAQVFANAPDKRYAVFVQYTRSVPIAQTLSYAKTPDEKAAVWLLAGTREPGKALEALTQMSRYAPACEGFQLLALREVSKLEDWIYTPYYTMFAYSLSSSDYWSEKSVTQKAQKNLLSDRDYAAKVLAILQQANGLRKKNPALWTACVASLQTMQGKNTEAIRTTDNYLHSAYNYTETSLIYQIKMLKAVAQMNGMSKGKASIPKWMQPLLQEADNNGENRFLFAIGRELEFKGNTTYAAFIFSKLNARNDNSYDWESQVFWRTRNNNTTLYFDYYDSYFFYLDAQYTPQQLTALIHATEHAGKGEFAAWKTEKTNEDIDRLYDLLGTKYIRLNELSLAEKAFSKVDKSLYEQEEYGFKTYLNANPFYANFYSEHNATPGDTIRFTKGEIVRTLRKHLALAAKPAAKDRDLHYFYAANCYYNMTFYGNSWMMRRYWWSTNEQRSKLPDDIEYRTAALAKTYYKLAEQCSRNKRFAALCLRMEGKCESRRLRQTLNLDDAETHFRMNPYYKDLKKKYPKYYEELISNCESFNDYFAARH